MCVSTFLGAEYEVFIQYYNKLIESLRNCTNMLYYWCMDHRRSPDRELFFYVMSTEDTSKAGILLARLAIQLYYDNTHSFYKMLKSMQYDYSAIQLAEEIHKKIKEFDPLMSSGMYINLSICWVCLVYRLLSK